jgi:hypothetical protein
MLIATQLRQQRRERFTGELRAPDPCRKPLAERARSAPGSGRSR